ncbi:hypothetical protein EMIT0P74_110114 [Pseudomonas sp. IT-P74]
MLVGSAAPCRSEPAREKRLDNTVIQTGRVFVDVHREQARSYRICVVALALRSSVKTASGRHYWCVQPPD